MPVQQ
jgi:hypothetical protein